MRPSPVYPDLHVRTCDPCVFLQRAFTWHLSGYVFHSSISFKKKEKKRKELKMWFVFLFKVIHVHVYGFMRFSGWTCKSNRYFSNLFTLVQQKISKAYAINCSCFAAGAQKTLCNQKKRNNELKEIIHDRIPLLFRIYLCNFVYFQYIQADNRINTIHWCWCSLHAHDKSGFLYTCQCLWNHRWKNGISELCKNCRA